MILTDQADLFADLYGLRAAFGAELVEETAGVGLDRVFTDEEFFGNLSVAESLGDEFEDLEFAFGDAEASDFCCVQSKWFRRGHRDFFDNHDLFFARQFESEP